MNAPKPQLAEDAVLEELITPCWVQPKIDGVRALNRTGRLTGRSLDEFKGYLISDFFSRPGFLHLDGEMILGNKPNCTNRLCSATTGAMGRFKDVTEMADIHWWVFDYLADPSLPYNVRYTLLEVKVQELAHPRVHLVPYKVCRSLDGVKAAIAEYANMGYEGTIIRNPYAPIKPGRATRKGQELWRVKPWADAEMLVTGITEGNSNANEAETNSLGRTKRSSAAAGLVPNGQVGSIQGTMLADFFDPFTGALLFAKGLPITVSPGEMTVAEATYYFEHPDEIVNHIVKFKHMTHGVKDLPRFGTYISHRLREDMSK